MLKHRHIRTAVPQSQEVSLALWPEAPLLQRAPEDFGNLLAITQTTPGPISVNAATFFGYRLLANQYPLRDAMFGLNYYRLVESLPVLQLVIPAVTLLAITASWPPPSSWVGS